MLQIDDKIVSFDVVEEYFLCDLNACQGICCVDGDSGASLKKDELRIIKKVFPKIKKYLSEKHLQEIEKVGLYVKDIEGDMVTPCLETGECVFLTYDENDEIYKCAFEIAYEKGEIDFWKPISCHLYPIRLSKFKTFTAVNYQTRNICAAGRFLGNKEKLKVYEFLKAPLIREFGEEWFEKLDYAAKNYKIER
ncbi:MAG: DUF3109 family protein [Bacteroidales bacterium]|nr:DUF3109 family protein [Bacteroidales bacterium]